MNYTIILIIILTILILTISHIIVLVDLGQILVFITEVACY